MSPSPVPTTVYARGTVTHITTNCLERIEDGSIRAHMPDGTVVTYPDEASARTATNYQGLIFTPEEIAEQDRVRAWQQQALYINGQFQNEPYDDLATHLQYLADGDARAAGSEVERFYARQGFSQYVGAYADEPTLAIIEIARDVIVKSGRVFLAGDLALARPREDGFSAFSARAGHNIHVPRKWARALPQRQER